MTDTKKLYTVDEVCALYNISRSLAYELIGKKVFQRLKIGRKTVITAESLDAWMAGMLEAGAASAARTQKAMAELNAALPRSSKTE